MSDDAKLVFFRWRDATGCCVLSNECLDVLRCNECLDVGNDVVDNSMIRVSEQFLNAESWVDGQVGCWQCYCFVEGGWVGLWFPLLAGVAPL